MDPLLRVNQNGFRTGRSKLPQILTLRRLMEGIKQKQLPAILTFVDISKAFDSIHRGKLMEIDGDLEGIWNSSKDSGCHQLTLQGHRSTGDNS